MPSPTDASRWRAVQARDRGADGQFVYAVNSTGIYCRPSCPSRRPRRDRVRFFSSGEAASQAGFRACRRCRPDADAAPWTEKAERARRWMDAHADVRPTLERLARVVGASPWHLQRSFKQRFGLTPREYAQALRTASVKRELKRTSVTDAMYAAGFGSPSRLYAAVPGALGMTPSAYGAGGANERISYDIVATPLGMMLAAATARGLCRVALGEDAGELERRLREEFPSATLRRRPGTMRPAVAALRAAAGGSPLQAALPLDVRATAFQQKVWQALRAIPAGETATYAEIARRVGQPGASRAVARACAANPLAIAVPCHRVVPASGGIGGYRWGSERKKKLLERESARR